MTDIKLENYSDVLTDVRLQGIINEKDAIFIYNIYLYQYINYN